MITIILDTSIIIRQPRILGLKSNDFKFHIPVSVIDELSKNSNRGNYSFEERRKILNQGLQEGTISLLGEGTPGFQNEIRSNLNTKLSNADLAILYYAKLYKEKNIDVAIATLDKEIIRQALESNIKVLSEIDINNISSKFIEPKEINSSVQSSIVEYEKKEKRTLIFGIFFGVIISFLSIYIYKNIGLIYSSINIWGTIILTLLSGIMLFIFREKYRLSYGVLEFLVGVFSIIIVFKSQNFNFEKIDFNNDLNLKLLGGLYIMVRGQDNIMKSIKETKIGFYIQDKIGIRE